MRSERGFTLLEVVVAFAIAALALSVLFRAATGGMTAVATAGRYEEAVSRAKSHLAAIGHEGAITEGETEGDDGSGFHWRIRIVAGRCDQPVGWSTGALPPGRLAQAHALFGRSRHLVERCRPDPRIPAAKPTHRCPGAGKPMGRIDPNLFRASPPPLAGGEVGRRGAPKAPSRHPGSSAHAVILTLRQRRPAHRHPLLPTSSRKGRRGEVLPGFTLLEILVVLVVLGLLMTGLTKGVQLGLQAMERQSIALGDRAELDAVDRTLRDLVTHIDPGGGRTQMQIEGKSDSFHFISRLPRAVALLTRQADMTLLLDDDHRLILRWKPALHEIPFDDPPDDTDTVLLDKVDKLEIAYWAPDDGGGQPAGWRDDWSSPYLPFLVRLRISFPGGRSPPLAGDPGGAAARTAGGMMQPLFRAGTNLGYNTPSRALWGCALPVTMLRDFLAWWVQQLAELLPDRLRRPDAAGADALLIEPDGPLDGDPPAVELLVRKRGQTSRLGRFALDGLGMTAAQRAAALAGGPLPIRLRLPPGLLLEKHLSLPLAAERELARVVGYEMDRETPFSTDEVYWDSAVEQRDRANGRLKLRLSLVPKAPVQALIAALQAAGLAPTARSMRRSASGAFRPIALARGAGQRGLVGARAVPVAAIVCMALAVLALAVPFLRQAIELGRVESRIAELQPSVDEAEALRKRIEGSGAGGDVLTEQRAKMGDVLKVLAAATQILPDDTHLTDFTMRQRKLSLVGQSADASKLIGALSQDQTFQNPVFAAPVTTMPGAHMDVFSISAEARP